MVELFPKDDFSRADRVGQSLKRELGEVLQREVKDPRLRNCVVSRVRVSNDLKVAWVGLSVFPDDKWDDAERALNKAKGFLRREVSKRIGLRRSPELRFERDESATTLLDMNRLLETVDKGDDEEE